MSLNIDLKEWESKSALLLHLTTAGDVVLTIGLEAEAPRKFYSFSLQSESGKIEVGILSSGLGIRPVAIMLDGTNKIIVGHDKWLTGIDIDHAKTCFNELLNGVFYEFVTTDSNNEVLIIHELGVIKINTEGKKQWTVDTDVIENYSINEDKEIILTVMDQSNNVIVNPDSGKVL